MSWALFFLVFRYNYEKLIDGFWRKGIDLVEKVKKFLIDKKRCKARVYKAGDCFSVYKKFN